MSVQVLTIGLQASVVVDMLTDVVINVLVGVKIDLMPVDMLADVNANVLAGVMTALNFAVSTPLEKSILFG